MLNLFKKKKLPLLDPNNYSRLKIDYQNTIWDGHAYFLQILWANKAHMMCALTSFYGEQKFFLEERSPSPQLNQGNQFKLKPISHNHEQLAGQFLLYVEISFHKIIEELQGVAKKLKSDSQESQKSKDHSDNLFLAQSEEQNFSWLEATLKVLKKGIQEKTKTPDYLLQYHIDFNSDDFENFLKIKIYNLHFHLAVKQNQIHLIVIDIKSGNEEIPLRYDLIFFEQLPRVIDLITDFFEFIRDNTKVDIVPK